MRDSGCNYTLSIINNDTLSIKIMSIINNNTPNNVRALKQLCLTVSVCLCVCVRVCVCARARARVCVCVEPGPSPAVNAGRKLTRDRADSDAGAARAARGPVEHQDAD